jgi:hypothetical protein
MVKYLLLLVVILNLTLKTSVSFVIQQKQEQSVASFQSSFRYAKAVSSSTVVLCATLPAEAGDNQSPPPSTNDVRKTFPVLSFISGKEWNGRCRYVNAELKLANNLKLVGGLRYDIEETTCTLSSFLTFPNGQTREVVMKGVKEDGPSPTLRLDSTSEDGGPIYMLLTELSPDTVLINEVEKSSGKIIMTSSLSIVNEGKELVQVSHEVGDGTDASIEGHQVWRLKQVPIEFNDFTARDTTGR